MPVLLLSATPYNIELFHLPDKLLALIGNASAH